MGNNDNQELFNELIVDNFAGGGGASQGIYQATGRHVDIAINHDPDAIAMHQMNHPSTKHYCESVWEIDPVKAVNGLPVTLAWFSPDCKHFSKAKGSKPVDKSIRGLAWVTLRWAILVRPRVIMLENVEEFKTWGPLNEEGKPCKVNQGIFFEGFKIALSTGLGIGHKAWKDVYSSLFKFNYDVKYKLGIFKAIKKGCGYQVEHNELRACDYGAPTIRKRLFLVARCDGNKIVWPKETHGNPESDLVKNLTLSPYKTAAECIDWSIACPSIFERKKPLAENTLRRIAKGIQRFVVDNPEPYIVSSVSPFITEHANASSQRNMPGNEPLRTICAQVKGGHFALVTTFLIKYYGMKNPNEVRGHIPDQPLHTLTTENRYGVVTSHLIKFRGTNIGHKADEPMHTITAGGNHLGEVRAFLIKYYGNEKDGCNLNEPLHTVTGRDRFGLVIIHGQYYQIADIGMRMLTPRELFTASSFRSDYIIDIDPQGKKVSKEKQVARCGNAVPPVFSEVLVRENLPELCTPKLSVSAA